MKYQGKHCRRGWRSKAFTAMLALMLVLAAYWAVGGTAAWLAAKSEPIVSTFTCGDINITLTEMESQEQTTMIIPGVDITKKLRVMVEADSVDCWLFVRVEEAGTFVDGVTYSMDDSWTKLDGTGIPENVYYREVKAATADRLFTVLRGDKITVSPELRKEDIQNITTPPSLTFTAYAVQRDGIDTVAEAWAKVDTAAEP